MTKRELGQYFTRINPFVGDAWNQWKALLPSNKIVEPFAGECDLAKHLPEMQWTFYDIDPKHNFIIKNDSIYEFPTGFDICITNPPYLGKSSAKRMNLGYDYKLPDLYLECIQSALLNCKYVAAIIPSAFISNNYFKDRLLAVDIITKDLFEDTDIPVCVAYFVPDRTPHFNIYKNGNFVICKQLTDVLLKRRNDIEISFNEPDGNLGLHAVDGTTGQRIRFCMAEEISRDVKTSDRAITKILLYNIYVDKKLVDNLNEILENYRRETHDSTLTSFRGKQLNGDHRKRISYKIVRQLINSIEINHEYFDQSIF